MLKYISIKLAYIDYISEYKASSMKSFILVVLGILYYFLIQTYIVDMKHDIKNGSLFTFVIKSHITQNVKLHVSAQKNHFDYIRCNQEKISFLSKEWQWFEGVGEQAVFRVHKGSNHCLARVKNNRKNFIPTVKRKLTFFDYVVFFILWGLPFFSLIFILFIKMLDIAKQKVSLPDLLLRDSQKPHKKIFVLMGIILAIGVLVRILYFHKFGIMSFQHDWQGHVEFIKYIAENWTLPLPSKGLEFPQQPLYYLIAGAIYSLLTFFNFSDMDALYGVAYFSLLCSMLFLYYGYKFITLLTDSAWIQTIAIVFLSLTPSIVYLSARINNDSLVMGLAAFSLYSLIKSYQSSFQIDFYKSLMGVSLLFIAKISAAPLELLFFALLILIYWHTNQKEKSSYLQIKKKLYIFSLTGMFLLGFTLLRVYLPVENTLHMVNSSGSFPGQVIKNLDFSYFGTFHLPSLLKTGYSYVFGEDTIRYSFITYQYATMFFGEFGYTSYMKQHEGLKEVMQAILLFGTIYIVGFLSFVIHFRRMPLLHKLLFGTLILNFLLILKFIFSYPSICNTDFRYFVASFLLFSFVFSFGLNYLNDNKWIKYGISLIVSLLAISEILFFSLMLK